MEITNTTFKTSQGSILTKLFGFFSVLLLFLFVSLWHLYSGLYEIFQEIRSYGLPNDPKELAGEISTVLTVSIAGLILVLPGWVSAMGLLLFSKFNSKLAFRFWRVASFILILILPVGTLLRATLALTLYAKRIRFQYA
jgi:hypothetical protein